MEIIGKMFKAMESDADFTRDIFEQAKNGGNAAAVAMAKGKGFDITEEDWQNYLDWSKSITAGIGSKELDEEELESVAGGNGPQPKEKYSDQCWFFASGNAEMKFGAMRKRCKQFSCSAIPFGELMYFWCRCHGRDRCIDSWHIVESTPQCPQK